MKSTLLSIAVLLLLAAGVAGAFAQVEARRDADSAFYGEQASPDRGTTETGWQEPDRRRPRSLYVPEGAANDGNSDNSGDMAAYQHRPGRLSPEERRALRRQIGEVGQDIYAPRR